MTFKYLKEELNSIRAHDYDTTNITAIDYSKGIITFEFDRAEINAALETKKEDDEYIAKQDKEILEKEEENAKLMTRINELESELNNFVADKEGSALDLLARAKNAEVSELNCRKTLQDIKGIYSGIMIENEKLRARKNKATVSRNPVTGKLVAEFNGKKFNLEEFRVV